MTIGHNNLYGNAIKLFHRSFCEGKTIVQNVLLRELYRVSFDWCNNAQTAYDSGVKLNGSGNQQD